MKAGDQELIQGCLNRDREAYTMLLNRFQGPVYDTACRLVGVQDAQDITQDVFLKVFRKLPEFRREAALNTWIYRIAVNTCRDYLRKRQGQPHLQPLEESMEGDQNTETTVENRSRQGDIHKALLSLTTQSREVLVLRELRGHTYEEMARILNIRQGTVKSRLARARQEFREICRKGGLLDG